MSNVDHLVIACAGVGSRLGMGLPKALIEVGGQTLLRRLLRATRAVPNVRVIVGFQEEDVIAEAFRARKDVVIVRNPAFLTTSTLTSFARGAEGLVGKTIFMDGDLVVDPAEFERFRARAATVDELYGHCPVRSDDPVYAHLSADGGHITAFSRRQASTREWASVFCGEPARLFGRRPILDQRSGSVFEYISAELPLPAAPIDVAEVDTPQDLARLRELLAAPRRRPAPARPEPVVAAGVPASAVH